jgi:diacylglycerol kinase (ATP)
MRKKRHLALILHGARADLPALRHLVEWVRAKGHVVRPRVTWEAGDGAELAREAVAAGVDTVVACGGDGTVNEVLNGLDGSDVPMGIVPIGTANDFAKQVGIPDDADHAMDVILRGHPQRIDTASLNGRRFLNVSTAGVGAEATAETPTEAKQTLGALAYAITGIRKLKDLEPKKARVRGPGFAFSVDFFLLAVGNARVTGGGTAMTPLANVRDGLLDLCIVEAMGKAEFAKLLLLVKRGEHLESEGVRYMQVSEVRISPTEPITVNVDGESSTARRLDYRARPSDLSIYLPHLPGEPSRGSPP